MPGTQELTRRIKSIKSTRKITKAMQMVSAAKMRKSQNAALASRGYADQAWELIHNLGGKSFPNEPLIKYYPNAEKVGVVLITTNRGLVGGFNANLIAQLKSVQQSEVLIELVVLGKKGREGSLRLRQNIIAEFLKYDARVPISEIYPIAKFVINAYASGQYREIKLIYNKFVSTLVQKATLKQLLPFRPPEAAEPSTEYLFEPSPQIVLKHLLPRIIESQIYQAILENDASEHSARMVMMKNATEAAGDLIDDLTLTYNQLRQNKITTELSEITAGKIALEK